MDTPFFKSFFTPRINFHYCWNGIATELPPKRHGFTCSNSKYRFISYIVCCAMFLSSIQLLALDLVFLFECHVSFLFFHLHPPLIYLDLDRQGFAVLRRLLLLFFLSFYFTFSLMLQMPWITTMECLYHLTFSKVPFCVDPDNNYHSTLFQVAWVSVILIFSSLIQNG